MIPSPQVKRGKLKVKPAQVTEDIVTPVTIETRAASGKRLPEAYVMQPPRTKPRYVAGLSASRSPTFHEDITSPKDLINEGVIKTKADARAYCESAAANA